MVVLYSKLERLLDVAETRSAVREGRSGNEIGNGATMTQVEHGVVEDIVRQVLDSHEGRQTGSNDAQDAGGTSGKKDKSTHHHQSAAAEAYLASILKDVYTLDVQAAASESDAGADGETESPSQMDGGAGGISVPRNEIQASEPADDTYGETQKRDENEGAQTRSGHVQPSTKYYKSEHLAALGTGFEETMQSFQQLQRYLNGGERPSIIAKTGTSSEPEPTTLPGPKVSLDDDASASLPRVHHVAPTKKQATANTPREDNDALHKSLRNLTSKRNKPGSHDQRRHRPSVEKVDIPEKQTAIVSSSAPPTTTTSRGDTTRADYSSHAGVGTDMPPPRIVARHVDAAVEPEEPSSRWPRDDTAETQRDAAAPVHAGGPTQEGDDKTTTPEHESDALANLRRIFATGFEEIATMKTTKLIEEGARRQRLQALRDVDSAHALIVDQIGEFDYHSIRDELNTIDERMRAIDALFPVEAEKKAAAAGLTPSVVAYSEDIAKTKRRLERSTRSFGAGIATTAPTVGESGKRREDPETRRDRSVAAWLQKRGALPQSQGAREQSAPQVMASTAPAHAAAATTTARASRSSNVQRAQAGRALVSGAGDRRRPSTSGRKGSKETVSNVIGRDIDDDDDDRSSTVTSSSVTTAATSSTRTAIPFREIAAVFNTVVMHEQQQGEDDDDDEAVLADRTADTRQRFSSAGNTSREIHNGDRDDEDDGSPAEHGIEAAPTGDAGLEPEKSTRLETSSLSRSQGDTAARQNMTGGREGEGDDGTAISELHSSDSGLEEDVLAELEGETISQMILLMRKQQQKQLEDERIRAHAMSSLEDAGSAAADIDVDDLDADEALADQLANAVYTTMMMREAQQILLDDTSTPPL